MTFTKAFASRSEKSVYPKWIDVELTPEEESAVDEEARKQNIALMSECIRDAKSIIATEGLKSFQTNLIDIAIALFEKRSSHSVFWKENKAKEKFDEMEQR